MRVDTLASVLTNCKALLRHGHGQGLPEDIILLAIIEVGQLALTKTRTARGDVNVIGIDLASIKTTMKTRQTLKILNLPEPGTVPSSPQSVRVVVAIASENTSTIERKSQGVAVTAPIAIVTKKQTGMLTKVVVIAHDPQTRTAKPPAALTNHPVTTDPTKKMTTTRPLPRQASAGVPATSTRKTSRTPRPAIIGTITGANARNIPPMTRPTLPDMNLHRRRDPPHEHSTSASPALPPPRSPRAQRRKSGWTATPWKGRNGIGSDNSRSCSGVRWRGAVQARRADHPIA